jgi:immunoglobulin-binding protein 1
MENGETKLQSEEIFMDRPLKEVLQDALAAKEAISNSTNRFDSPQFIATVQKAVQLFEECQTSVRRLGLYSDNEEIDDLTTTSLDYLMIDYHLATVLERVPKNLPSLSKEEALKILDRTVAAYLSFVKKLYDYKILDNASSKLYDELLDGQAAQALSTRPSLTQQLANSAKSRDEKIRQYKLEKALEQQIESLSKSKDEDSIRQTFIFNLRLHSFKAFDSLSSLALEKSMLEQAPEPIPGANMTFGGSRLPLDQRERERNADASSYNTRVESSSNAQPLLSSKGKVNRPFMLVNSRDQVKKGVFGTGQYLPTMTVEEYLDEELKRGGIVKGGGKQSEESESSDEDNEEKSDAKTYKAREWDEFTEQNPKGSGNTMNRG